jgi:hypothetical protein
VRRAVPAIALPKSISMLTCTWQGFRHEKKSPLSLRRLNACQLKAGRLGLRLKVA